MGYSTIVRMTAVWETDMTRLAFPEKKLYLVDVVEEDTLADALAGGLGPENHHSFAMCRDLLDGTVLVGEDEIAAAMAALFRDEHLVVEGGGAVGVAALMAGTIEPGERTVVVLSGGNVDRALLMEVVGR